MEKWRLGFVLKKYVVLKKSYSHNYQVARKDKIDLDSRKALDIRLHNTLFKNNITEYKKNVLNLSQGDELTDFKENV